MTAVAVQLQEQAPGKFAASGPLTKNTKEPPVVIDEFVQRKAAERMKKMRPTEGYGLNEWKGMVRTAERKGHDFRR